ncbi:MAG: diaminopimelate decarboxylase [Paludibacteraceae bacterium]|nr:diaminopimelate decarboxylase [Paludibacteraceae bacterium]HPG55354.1 diaminopimelate decarboxylase [Candidatus Enterocola sp.]
MIKGKFPIDKFKGIKTPFYYYDLGLLRRTLDILKAETDKYGFTEHYAVKANANPTILKIISSYGFGADCVSGGEIKAALEAGFPANRIVFAGVGKADWEIELGLDNDIFCFNIESLAELNVINEFAAAKHKVATIEIRVNPDIDAHTHSKITTGLQENKFGINLEQLDDIIETANKLKNINFIGLHFHIGSQITDMSVFKDLCLRVNEIQYNLLQKGIHLQNLNFGGGLGVDYHHPNHYSIPDFTNYFAVFNKLVERRENQDIHFELGRAVIAQCGSLISKVLYIKEGQKKKFAILDAGMTDLIRPAMYDAYHRPENITSDLEIDTYDIVGPICESSDVFGKDIELNKTKRGDLIAFRTAGAYGEVMASQYNLRAIAKSYFSDTL